MMKIKTKIQIKTKHKIDKWHVISFTQENKIRKDGNAKYKIFLEKS